MKKALKKSLLIVILIVPFFVSAQSFESKGGFRFGIGMDTVKYMIGRPIDNWFVAFNGGVKTYIGSEVEPEARWNGIMPHVDIEMFKWVIPDVAVGVSLSGFNARSQTRSANPYVDFSKVSIDTATNNYPYQKFSFNYFALNGELIIDWTNFFRGYSYGRSERNLHLQSVLGLGFARATGTVRSQKWIDEGTKPVNFELTALAGLNFRYTMNERLCLQATGKWMFTRRSFDYSNEADNKFLRFDMIPSVTVGVAYGLTGRYGQEFSPVELQVEQAAIAAADYADKLKDLEVERDSLRMQLTVAEAIEADSLRSRVDSLNIAVEVASSPIAQTLSAIRNGQLFSALVFFEIDRYDISKADEYRLKWFAQQVQGQGLANEKFLIISAADSKTGSVQHNRWLSQKRSGEVFNCLVKNGMKPENFERYSLGGIADIQPYELNRMVIIVVDNEEVMEIIERELPSFRRNSEEKSE